MHVPYCNLQFYGLLTVLADDHII